MASALRSTREWINYAFDHRKLPHKDKQASARHTIDPNIPQPQPASLRSSQEATVSLRSSQEVISLCSSRGPSSPPSLAASTEGIIIHAMPFDPSVPLRSSPTSFFAPPATATTKAVQDIPLQVIPEDRQLSCGPPADNMCTITNIPTTNAFMKNEAVLTMDSPFPVTRTRRDSIIDPTHPLKMPNFKKFKKEFSWHKLASKVKNRLRTNVPKVKPKVEKITVDSEQAQNIVIPFILELGKALHTCGVPAHRLEYELTLVSSSFGIDGNFFYTPTGIFCSFGAPGTILSPYTHLIRVGSPDFDLEKLCLLEQLAKYICTGKIPCSEGVGNIRHVMSLPPFYSRHMIVLCFVLSSFAIAIIFGTSWFEVGLCSAVGLYVGFLAVLSEKINTIGRLMEALSGLGGAIFASIINAYVYPVNVFIITLGGTIWLVPGLSVTVAIAEISTRNLISGTTRLTGALTSMLQLTFGILTGVKFGQLFMPIRDVITPTALNIGWVIFANVIAALSFAILLRAPPRQFWIILISTALGNAGGQIGDHLGAAVGAFFGAFLICVFGNCYARVSQRGLASVPIMTGILLLVPGSMGVRGLVAFSGGDTEAGITFFGTMFQIAMSLTMGLLSANLLVRPYKAL